MMSTMFLVISILIIVSAIYSIIIIGISAMWRALKTVDNRLIKQCELIPIG